MADNAYQFEAIAGVYAQALVNEAQKRGILSEITEDVRGIQQLLWDHAGFRAFAEALSIGEDERLASLQRIFDGRVHQLVIETLKSMSRRNRLMLLPAFTEAFEAILRKLSGHVDAELVSAAPLRQDVLERIRQAVGRSVGGTADLHASVDPALIGGMTITVGDMLIDGSVASQLARMREQLERRGTARLNLAKVTA